MAGGDPEYDPYPVCLGFHEDDNTAPWLGYLDAKVLGLIAQEAIEKVYNDKLLAGYLFKLEGAFRLVPFRANRVNLHAHVVANGLENDPQVLADALFLHMRRGLRRYQKHFHGSYHPDVLVERIQSAAQLEKAICYSDKAIPIGLIVAEAMGRPEAKRGDGSWDREYVSEVHTSLMRLVNDDIPAMLTSLKSERRFQNLRRRKTVGNFCFNDRGTCIGSEPNWHKKLRRKNSKRDRAARLRRKKWALKRLDESIAWSPWPCQSQSPSECFGEQRTEEGAHRPPGQCSRPSGSVSERLRPGARPAARPRPRIREQKSKHQ